MNILFHFALPSFVGEVGVDCPCRCQIEEQQIAIGRLRNMEALAFGNQK